MTDADRSSRRPRDVQLVGVAEVAARLGISAERVRQLAKAKQLPEPVGQLGRQMVWQWRDVETWATREGRLPDDAGVRRQRLRHAESGASLQLVVDEVIDWGSPVGRDACHVRIWAPKPGSPAQHVVLLGQPQDTCRLGITKGIESVISTVSHRYLGALWKTAQFYEYWPSWPLNSDEFHHVTFNIEEGARQRIRGLGRRRHDELSRALGGTPVDVAWRSADREELERVTGDTISVWTSGTYTRELLTLTTPSSGRTPGVVWDPERARDCADIATDLSSLAHDDADMTPASYFGIDLELSREQAELALGLVAAATLEARDHANDDVKTQPADAAIWLNAPTLSAENMLLAASARVGDANVDGGAAWALLTTIRDAIVNTRGPTSECLVRQQQLLVPGLHGGWVELHWADANVDELTSEREGVFGPIAIPADLVNASRIELEPVERLMLLIEVLVAYLDANWKPWSAVNVPSFRPSEIMSAKGPLTRAYMDSVDWGKVEDPDGRRLRRFLSRLGTVGRVGTDCTGCLVVVAEDGCHFLCEWPISGAPDPTLMNATIRADRDDAESAIPIFVEHASGELTLLPSAPNGYWGNAYAWGYPGSGPMNLEAATIDLIRRATGTHPSDTTRAYVKHLVRERRIPNWRVSDLASIQEGHGAADTTPGTKAST